MKTIILDTETTGLENPEVIELAYRELDYPSFTLYPSFHSFYKPSKPIELGALATHNILMSELENSPASSTCTLPEEVEYIIGHNVDYDWNALGRPDVGRICTLALSRYVFPDLATHTQSAMLYHLLGDRAKKRLINAHSAVVDVENCTLLLSFLIDEMEKLEHLQAPKTIEDLYQLSEFARIPTKITFGKFKGKPYTALDKGYVDWWLYKSDTKPDYYQIQALKLVGLL